MGQAGLIPGDDTVRRLRARAQRLDRGAADATPYGILRHLCGIPAQWMPSTPLVLRARTAGGDGAALDRARRDQRSVVRTWAMRGTLHLLAADDVAWVVGLLGAIADAADRPRRLQLGLDDDASERGAAAVAHILETRGPSTRAEIVDALADRDIVLDPKSQAPPHLLSHAARIGLICFGPDRDDGEPTYVRTEDWIGPQRPADPDRALAELARRYLGAFGPAGIGDLAAWSGAGRQRARRALELIADELTQVRAAGADMWMPKSVPTAPDASPTRLLPLFDPYLLGYASRDLVLAREHAKQVQRGGGYIRPTLLWDDRVAATWSQQRRGGRLAVEIEPFAPLPDRAWADVEREVADIGRYLRLEAITNLPPAAT